MEGAMEEREQSYFEDAVAIDPALREEMEFYLDKRSTLRMNMWPDPKKGELVDTLEQMNEKYFSEKGGILSPIKRLLGRKK